RAARQCQRRACRCEINVAAAERTVGHYCQRAEANRRAATIGVRDIQRCRTSSCLRKRTRACDWHSTKVGSLRDGVASFYCKITIVDNRATGGKRPGCSAVAELKYTRANGCSAGI